MAEKEFKSQHCRKSYASKSDLRRHTKAMHKRASVNPSKIVVSDEKIDYLTSKIVKCPKCEFILPDEVAVGAHVSTSHKSSPYRHTCFVCLKPYYTSAELQKHMRLHIFFYRQPVFSKSVRPVAYFFGQNRSDGCLSEIDGCLF